MLVVREGNFQEFIVVLVLDNLMGKDMLVSISLRFPILVMNTWFEKLKKNLFTSKSGRLRSKI